MQQLPDDPRAGPSQVPLFLATLITILFATVAIPMAASRAAADPTATNIATAVVFFVLTGLGVALIVRLARAPGPKAKDRARRAGLTLALTGAFVMLFVGGVLSAQAQGLGEPDNRALQAVAAALLIAAILSVFLALAFIPSTERELRRTIDLEASSIALGTCLFVFWTYPALEEVLSFPEFNSFIASIAVLLAYMLARLALRIRYR